MLYVLSDVIAPWGQAAAIILAIYMFVYILIGLAISAGLMFGLAWVREKAELLKKLRPTVESVNTTLEEANKGELPPPGPHENKIIRTVAQVPMTANTIERKVDEGSDRVAQAVIEFRARTVQLQQTLKAFFLPGLVRQEQIPTAEAEKSVEFKSPGYRILREKVAESTDGKTTQTIAASQIKALGAGQADQQVAEHLKEMGLESPATPPPAAPTTVEKPQARDAFIP